MTVSWKYSQGSINNLISHKRVTKNQLKYIIQISSQDFSKHKDANII